MTFLIPIVKTWWFRDEELNWKFTRDLDLSDIYTQRSCIKHKITSKKGHINCIECDVEKLIRNYVPYTRGIRFETKPPPLEHLVNRERGLCWCGNPPKKPRRMYCSDEHAHQYYMETLYWSHFRSHFLRKHVTKIKREDRAGHDQVWYCRNCKKQLKDDSLCEVDHIQAVILGGWMFDEDNLQILCESCHKEKTKSDVGILAWWRRESNYDAAAIEIDIKELDPNQMKLELFV